MGCSLSRLDRRRGSAATAIEERHRAAGICRLVGLATLWAGISRLDRNFVSAVLFEFPVTGRRHPAERDLAHTISTVLHHVRAVCRYYRGVPRRGVVAGRSHV